MLYYETYSIYPLLQFNQVLTTVARLPRDLSVRVMRSEDPEERARRAGAYVLLEKMIRKHAEGFKNNVESIIKPEYGAIFDSGSLLSALRYDSYGKPYFEGRENAAFNLSHSRHLVSCALNLSAPGEPAKPVGIDTEYICGDRERATRVINGYFTEGEKRALDGLDGDPAAFYRAFARIWTRKEALLKFWGVGLARISAADTEKIASFGCQYIEKEETITFRDPDGKTVEEAYLTTVCLPLD